MFNYAFKKKQQKKLVCTWEAHPSSAGTTPAGCHHRLTDWTLNTVEDARSEKTDQDTPLSRAGVHQGQAIPQGPVEAWAERKNKKVLIYTISTYTFPSLSPELISIHNYPHCQRSAFIPCTVIVLCYYTYIYVNIIHFCLAWKLGR